MELLLCPLFRASTKNASIYATLAQFLVLLVEPKNQSCLRKHHILRKGQLFKTNLFGVSVVLYDFTVLGKLLMPAPSIDRKLNVEKGNETNFYNAVHVVSLDIM